MFKQLATIKSEYLQVATTVAVLTVPPVKLSPFFYYSAKGDAPVGDIFNYTCHQIHLSVR